MMKVRYSHPAVRIPMLSPPSGDAADSSDLAVAVAVALPLPLHVVVLTPPVVATDGVITLFANMCLEPPVPNICSHLLLASPIRLGPSFQV